MGKLLLNKESTTNCVVHGRLQLNDAKSTVITKHKKKKENSHN